MAIETKRYTHNFSIIALAETNEGPHMSSLYQLPGYNSFYQETFELKKKGSGVAMYLLDSLNGTRNNQLSQVTRNLETLFVSVSSEKGLHTIGVIYRPPGGNLETALSELSTLLNEAPKNTHIVGDFNQWRNVVFGRPPAGSLAPIWRPLS